MRGKSITSDEIYKGGWLIVLDGASCSGKSTMAKKIAEKFPETVEVIDVDYLFYGHIYIEKQRSLLEKSG